MRRMSRARSNACTHIRRKTALSCSRERCRRTPPRRRAYAKVLALGGDKIRSRYERDIGDGIDDIGPEDGAARFEFVVESGGADACFGSGQTLGAKQRIVFGEGCPLAKAAVQLVRRGRTKCAIAGERERPVAAKIADHGNARTERGVATV